MFYYKSLAHLFYYNKKTEHCNFTNINNEYSYYELQYNCDIDFMIKITEQEYNEVKKYLIIM